MNGHCDVGTYIFSLAIFFKRLFIFERQRESTSGGGSEREGDTEPEAGSGL